MKLRSQSVYHFSNYIVFSLDEQLAALYNIRRINGLFIVSSSELVTHKQ